MKIVEGLKRLNVIEKRIKSNCENITKYSSILSNEKPAFGTEESQRVEVNKLLQSSEDLVKEYLDLKCKIEKTNLSVKVQIAGREATISEFLVIKRKIAKIMEDVYKSLNTTVANHRLGSNRFMNTDQKVEVIQLFDESMKNNKLNEWQTLYEEIDSRLEVINATEDLVE